METQVINIATDWWMFGATVCAGLLTALVTIITVYFRLCYLTRNGQEKKKPLKIKQAYNCNWTQLGNIETNNGNKNTNFYYLLIEVKKKYQ